MKKLVPHDKFLELVEVIGSVTGSMLSSAKQVFDELEKKVASNEESTVALTQKVDSLGDLESRIAELESYHLAVADQGPASEYTGTGWYKATDTGVVYNKDVPEGETHIFEGDPVEYISVWTKPDALFDYQATDPDPETRMLKSVNGWFKDINRYATSNITNFDGWFQFSGLGSIDLGDGTVADLNLPQEGIKVGHYDTSNAKSMRAMFYESKYDGQVDLSNWDTSNVNSMEAAFSNSPASVIGLSDWDVSNVENMNLMFTSAPNFNQDLSQWCVAKIPGKPSRFDEGATSWTLPQPVWGTCPRGEVQAA